MDETLPADILLTQVHGNGHGDQSAFLTKAIVKATGCMYSHAALCQGSGGLIEATWPTVQRAPVEKYTRGNAAWLLLRPLRLSDVQREAVVGAMDELIGNPYPLGQLVLDGLDLLAGTSFFARAFSLPWWAVCSGSVALAYKRGAAFNFRDVPRGHDLPAHAVTPGTIYFHAQGWPEDFRMVAKGDVA